MKLSLAKLLAALAFVATSPVAPAQDLPSFGSLHPGAQLTDDGFGASIAVDGDRLIAGATRTSPTGTLSGSAEVFLRTAAGDWVKEADLVPPTGFNWDFHAMGAGVAIGGNYAAIGGAFGDLVVVYRRQGTTWSVDAVLQDPTSASADSFGLRLAFAGAQLLIADERESLSSGAESGAVYVYERNLASAWTATQALQASDAHVFAHFARDMDVDGDRAVFGTAHKFGLAGVTDGVAYVFERNTAGVWSEVAKLTDVIGLGTKSFGIHVALGGDYVFVCDQVELVGTGARGSLSLFKRNAQGAFPLVGKITSPQPSFQETFAFDVSATSDRLFVAAPLTTGDNQMGYMFELGPAGWVQSARLVEPPYVDPFGLAYRQTPGASVFAKNELLVNNLYFSLVSSFLYDVNRYDAGDFAASGDSLSVSLGGTQSLFLRPGASHAFESYFVLGSLTGTSPGLPLPGTALTLPLVLDGYFLFTLTDPAANALLPGHFGLLDANGQAATAVVLPPASSPALAGLTAAHAFALLGPTGFTYASSSEALSLLP